MNYREKTHLKNKFSINSSKNKNSPFGLLAIKDKFSPLPSIAWCGQSSGPFPNLQVSGNTTFHSLQFDPSNYQN